MEDIMLIRSSFMRRIISQIMQPIRLVEYIWYCIQIERECDREETIRFENLKRTGHI